MRLELKCTTFETSCIEIYENFYFAVIFALILICVIKECLLACKRFFYNGGPSYCGILWRDIMG